MKLLLTSAGFTTPELADTCAKLVGKQKDTINIAVINEAYAVEHGDHSWVLNDLNQIKQYFNGHMELVNLLALSLRKAKERLELADVIFVVGGHTDYLMSVFRKTGFAKLLPELLTTKVYVGSSAGSMVLCNRVSTEAYAEIYGEEGNYDVNRYLGLVDLAIKPHLGNPLFPNNNPHKLAEVTKNYKGLVYGLRDDSAIVIENNKQYTIGSKPIIIQNGILQAVKA